MKLKIFLLSMCLGIKSFGAVILVKEQPSPLEYRDDVYYWPQNFVIRPGTTTIFVTMDGINKVCFLNTAPSGMFEESSEINILINGIKTEWNCFLYKTTVFAVRP